MKIALVTFIAALALIASSVASAGGIKTSYNDGGGGGSQPAGIYTVLVQQWVCSPYLCSYYCRYADFVYWQEQLNCYLVMDFRNLW